MANKVHRFKDMEVEVILASKPTNLAPPIITLRAHYPRPIHSELMTHRVFSRNARSSRAVPVAKMLEEVREKPYIPWHWGKNQKGMQASEECNALVSVPTFNGCCEDLSNEDAWLRARDFAVMVAEGYMEAGYHKQVANRLLEPFSYIDTLVTSTQWANFFHLRDHEDAEPHFHDLAKLVREAIEDAEYQDLQPGEWHLPYFRGVEDYQGAVDYLRSKRQIMPTEGRLLNIYQKLSVARCARISYAPFDGDGSIEREIERHDFLVSSSPLHASPAEHQAMLDEGVTNGQTIHWMQSNLAGNLGPGWIQYRKTLPNEFIPN